MYSLLAYIIRLHIYSINIHRANSSICSINVFFSQNDTQSPNGIYGANLSLYTLSSRGRIEQIALIAMS